MIILADTREQLPYTFDNWKVDVNAVTLSTGDYSILGFENQIAIERKSIDDLISCLMGKNRERFEKELSRARCYELFAVVVESDLSDLAKGLYQSKMKPHAALQSISAFFVRYRVPFLFCGNRAGSEYMTFSLLQKYLQEIEKRYEKSKKFNQEVEA